MSATLKIALAALAISATAAAPAFADKPANPTFRVSYSDLDMANPAHGARLLSRIEFGARKVCRSAIPHSALFDRLAIECRQETVARAVQTLGFPTLTVAWNGKYAATVLASR